MARIIPFYIPSRHRKQERWTRPGTRARLLLFRPRTPRRYPPDYWRILGLEAENTYFRSS